LIQNRITRSISFSGRFVKKFWKKAISVRSSFIVGLFLTIVVLQICKKFSATPIRCDWSIASNFSQLFFFYGILESFDSNIYCIL